MDIGLVENNSILPLIVYEHDWIHILYIVVTTIFFLIQLCQRISIDLLYSSNVKGASLIPSLNRYPTELSPSPLSMSCIWYFVYLWQGLWIIYSIVGIFRRTSLGSYFYQYPCAMNRWCFFYAAFALILYTPQLAAATRNKYGIGISIFRHLGTLCEVIIILVLVHISLWENLKSYLRDKFFADVWLTRLLYHNGLALWASVLYYETCLSVVIGFIYSELISPYASCLIGCFLLLIGFIVYSLLENLLFYNSLAFTFSPWITFVWLLGGIVFDSQRTLSSSIYLIWFERVLGLKSVNKNGRWSLHFGLQKINLHELGHEFEPKANHPTPGSEVIKHLQNTNTSIAEGPVRRTGSQDPLLSVYFRDPDLNLIEALNQLPDENTS